MEDKLFSIWLFYIKLTKLKIQDLELICRVFIGDYSNVLNNKKFFLLWCPTWFMYRLIGYRLKYRLLHLASRWLFYKFWSAIG